MEACKARIVILLNRFGAIGGRVAERFTVRECLRASWTIDIIIRAELALLADGTISERDLCVTGDVRTVCLTLNI